MVRRTETGFIIEVTTSCHPADDYVETLTDIIGLLQAQPDDMQRSNYHLLELLQEMMPTFEQAKCMLDMNDGKIKQMHEKFVLTSCK